MTLENAFRGPPPKPLLGYRGLRESHVRRVSSKLGDQQVSDSSWDTTGCDRARQVRSHRQRLALGFIVTDMTATTAERMGVDFEQFEGANAAHTPVKVKEVGDGAGFVCGKVIFYVAGASCD